MKTIEDHINLTVEQIDGFWCVCLNGKPIQRYGTHARAWKGLDRLQGEPVNKQEERAAWWYKQTLEK